jgi:hypothetical protein
MRRYGRRVTSIDPGASRHISLATRMVAAQANCDIGEALGRMTIRADASSQTLEEMALDVLDRVICFDPCS